METHVESGRPAPPPEPAVRSETSAPATAKTATEARAATVEAPRPRPPLVPEQVAVGLIVAFTMAVGDGVRAALNETAPRVGAGELAVSLLHLVALYLPLGVLLGLASAALVAVARATPAVTPLRDRFAEPRRLVRNDPPVFAGGLGLAAGLTVVVLATHTIHELLTTRVHRADLAAWAMAGLAVAVLAGATLAGATVAALIRPLAKWLGPVASFATLALVTLVGVGVAAWLFLAGRPEIAATYGLAPLLWGPIAAVLYLGLAVVARRVFRRFGPRGWRAWAVAAAAVAAVALAWGTSGLTYGRSNRVRSVIEQRSVIGRELVRRYAGVTDMDDDGHAWAFGGRDCDDFDPQVHPGASDPDGDGVDADCFAGDGSPDVADLGDGRYGARPPELPPRPNVLLVTIDALRPDHIGAAGYERDTSPNLDRFASEAVRFETVIAQSSRSLRSIPAMMTGHYPSQIAFGPEFLWPSLLPSNTTVAEVLQRRGYETGVTMGTDYFHRVGGFFQGFEDVEEVLVYKPPRERTVDEAVQQLRQLHQEGRPFFQWVHLFNVHAPYLTPPAPSRFGDADIDRYDTEIRLADAQFERLMSALRDLELDRGTVVIVASDHGEAFEEHGVTGHSTTLYDEEILSTLMIRVPGVAPDVVTTPVALFDVAPTILNLANVDVPAPMPARSLLPLMTGEIEGDRERMIFTELMPDGLFPFDQKAVRVGDEKLIWWVQDGTFQLFDLAEDPEERNDLSDARRERALDLLGRLQAWVAQTNRPENRTDAFVDRHRLEAPPDDLTHPLNLRFPGLFTLLGCNLPETELSPGDTIDLECFYRVDSDTDLDVFFRVMIEGPAGYPVPPHFHALHYPLSGRYHTNQWREGEIIRDPTPIVVPDDIRTPVELRLTYAAQVRGQGLMSFQQGGRTAHSTTIDEIRIVDAPDAGAP